MSAALTDLESAHDALIEAVQAVPPAAFDWSPGAEEWSPRQILGHLAHGNVFFDMIISAARDADFGLVRLDRAQVMARMAPLRAGYDACTSPSEALAFFEREHQAAVALMAAIPEAELDRPFTLQSMRPGAAPEETTLRRRIVDQSANHLREHLGQLQATLAAWRAAQAG